MTRAVRNLHKMIRRWHKTIGLIIGLPILLTVVTGVLLQYPQLFGPDSETTTAITVDPMQTDHWLRGTNFGLHHSFDQGLTWQEAPLMWSPGTIQKLVFSPIDSRLIYALGSDALLFSRDSGRIWEILHLNFPEDIGWQQFMDLNLGQDGTMIILTRGGLARSQDGGLSWSTKNWASDGQESHALTFIHDLHTGFWIGTFGPWATTVTAAGTILLMCSGFLLVFLGKKNGRRSRD